MSQYYLHDGQAQRGPYTLEELRSESVTVETLIWYDGITDWTKASDVDSLKELFRKGPPPLPITVQESTAAVVPVKKKSLLPYIIAGVVLVVLIIGYLMYQNSKHEAEIINVQTALDQKNKEAEDQRLLQQQKENELKAANDALEARQMQYRNGWSRYVTLTGSKYMTSGIGGISDLDLTVSNRTEYPLDNVEVEVDYIKTSGGIYKTEKVVYDIIPAGTQKTLRAPNSSRGTSVNIRIQKVKATAFHFCYDYDYRIQEGDHGISTSPNGISGNPADLWKCN
jgi:hypothetical protein